MSGTISHVRESSVVISTGGRDSSVVSPPRTTLSATKLEPTVGKKSVSSPLLRPELRWYQKWIHMQGFGLSWDQSVAVGERPCDIQDRSDPCAWAACTLPHPLFHLLSQFRLSKSLMCGREVTGSNWFFQGTRDGDTVESMKRTDWGTGHGATELHRGCAGDNPMGDMLARAVGMGAHVQLTGAGGWGSPSAFPRVERGALLPAWGHA